MIKAVFENSIYSDQETITCMIFPENDFRCRKKNLIYSDNHILNKISIEIYCENDLSFILPIANIIEILPDRTGFVVIYDKNPDKFSEAISYPWFFEYPNNAAVYNADGSLRFQIKVTDNLDSDLYIMGFAQPSIEHPDKISVIINSTTHPKYGFHQLYAVDPCSPQLIQTKQQIQR